MVWQIWQVVVLTVDREPDVAVVRLGRREETDGTALVVLLEVLVLLVRPPSRNRLSVLNRMCIIIFKSET